MGPDIVFVIMRQVGEDGGGSLSPVCFYTDREEAVEAASQMMAAARKAKAVHAAIMKGWQTRNARGKTAEPHPEATASEMDPGYLAGDDDVVRYYVADVPASWKGQAPGASASSSGGRSTSG